MAPEDRRPLDRETLLNFVTNAPRSTRRSRLRACPSSARAARTTCRPQRWSTRRRRVAGHGRWLGPAAGAGPSVPCRHGRRPCPVAAARFPCLAWAAWARFLPGMGGMGAVPLPVAAARSPCPACTGGGAVLCGGMAAAAQSLPGMGGGSAVPLPGGGAMPSMEDIFGGRARRPPQPHGYGRQHGRQPLASMNDIGASVDQAAGRPPRAPVSRHQLERARTGATS
jgi:hypothetical protein